MLIPSRIQVTSDKGNYCGKMPSQSEPSDIQFLPEMGSLCVIKAQMHASGRGKARGVVYQDPGSGAGAEYQVHRRPTNPQVNQPVRKDPGKMNPAPGP